MKAMGIMTRGGLCRYSAAMWMVVLLVLVGTGNAAVTLRLVQVVHRHGSRTPVVSYNKTQLCGDVPCGYLNVPGQTMLVNAGKFLRNHYNNDKSNPFLPSESYDLSVSYSRSSDYPRTLQSAVGLLYGLFPNMSTAFPVVHTVSKRTDLLVISTNFPYQSIFYMVDDEWNQKVCNPKVDELIEFSTLQAIAKEAHSEGYCANPARRCKCAAKLFDIGAALAADGRIVSYPLLKANLEKLHSLVQFYFASEFAYNASDEMHVKMGSQGQNLAQEFLANAQLHMQGMSTYKLYHYSTHDTTLSPLAATLGDTTPDAALPPFAQLYAFELLYDDATNVYSMRVRRGSPGQTPDTKYAFNWDGFQLRCMDENGKVYKASGNTCLFYDFKRFVDSSKPTHPAGQCYLSDRYKSLLKCPTKEGEPLNSYCRAAREVCPAWSCAPGFTLNAVTLQCVCSSASCLEQAREKSSKGDGSTVSAGATAGIAIATFAVGVIFAGCVALLLSAWRAKSKPVALLESREPR